MQHPFKIALANGRYRDPVYMVRAYYGAGWFSTAFKKVKKTYNKVRKEVKPYYGKYLKPIVRKYVAPVFKEYVKPMIKNVNIDSLIDDYVPGGKLITSLGSRVYKDTLAKPIKALAEEALGKQATRRLEKFGNNMLTGNVVDEMERVMPEEFGLSDRVTPAALGLSDKVKGSGLRRKHAKPRAMKPRFLA